MSDISIEGAVEGGDVVVTLKGVQTRLTEAEFTLLGTCVDAIRDGRLTSEPPLERLKAVLESAIELAQSKGDEKQVWRLTIDRLVAIRESGLLKRCGLEDENLLDVVDEGYADETRSIVFNMREVLEKIDAMLPKSEQEDAFSPGW